MRAAKPLRRPPCAPPRRLAASASSSYGQEWCSARARRCSTRGLGLWVRDNHCVGWGLGDNPLPLVLADDVADALVAATLAPGQGVDGKAFNLCANPGLSGQDVVRELARVTQRSISFHPRRLWVSQAAEIGKWVVKRVGGRKVEFPSYRDLRSRALEARFECDVARKELGWRPIEEREAFLDHAVRIYAPPSR
jgi:nucleoside-diphosphate-sugar epimerase